MLITAVERYSCSGKLLVSNSGTRHGTSAPSAVSRTPAVTPTFASRR